MCLYVFIGITLFFNIIYINPIFTTMLVRPHIKPLPQLCSYNYEIDLAMRLNKDPMIPTILSDTL